MTTAYWPPSAGPSTLTGLADVAIASVANGDLLQFNSSSGKWENSPGVLNSLLDVNTAGVANFDRLEYDSATTTWKPKPYPSNLLTAGAVGCQYTTLQAAINAAAALATAGAPYTVEAYGVFTENITLKDYVWITGSDYGACIINGTVDGTGVAGGLKSCTVNVTPNADGFVGLKTGNCQFFRTAVNVNYAADYAFSGVQINSTTLAVFNESQVTISGASVNNTKDIQGILVSGTGQVALFGAAVVGYANAISGGHCCIKITGGAEIIVESSVFRMQETNAAFGGTAMGACCTSAGTAGAIREFNGCNFRLIGITGATIAFYLNAGGVGAEINYNSCTVYFNGFSSESIESTVAGDFQYIRGMAANRAAGSSGTGYALISPYDFYQTGRKVWGGSGTYYTVSGATFTVDRPGIGYIRSTPCKWAGGQSVTLTANATNYVYIDINGTLQKTTSPVETTWTDNIPLFEVLYDSTNHLIVREDHPNDFESSISVVWHRVFSILISGSGGLISRTGSGTGALAADREINISGGAKVEDHGLTTDINAGTSITIQFWYKNGSGQWKRHANQSQVPMVYGTTPTAMANGEYSVIRLYASKDDLNSSTPKYIGVIDAVKYSNATQADNAIATGTVRAADTTLAECELAQLGYAVILMNASGGYITKVTPAKQAFGAAFVGGTAATTADLVALTTTSFGNLLSAAESTVQAAMDVIDNLDPSTAVSLSIASVNATAVIIGHTGITTTILDSMVAGADAGRYTPHVLYGGVVRKNVYGKRASFLTPGRAGTWSRSQAVASVSSWRTQTSAMDLGWFGVCWSPELGLFCAVAMTDSGKRVMTSPDGITWTSRTSAADNDWRSVCWSPELGLFCAVALTGTGNRVMTSPDGITWTTRTSAADNNWMNICWSPELGLFCAVAQSGTGNRVMTSPDGITWTTRTSAADNSWGSVCWSPELGLFCTVATTGTGNRVMTSPDGITWTTRTSAADNEWRSVCWSPELGLFCTVAATGTGNRVMTANDLSSPMVSSTGGMIFGGATNDPYTSYHLTNKSLFSPTPTGANVGRGQWIIGANAYIGASNYSPTRLQGLTGSYIVFGTQADDTTTAFAIGINAYNDSATTSAKQTIAINGLGSISLGATTFTGQHTIYGTVALNQGDLDSTAMELRGSGEDALVRVRGGGTNSSNGLELTFIGSATDSTRRFEIGDIDSTIASFKGNGTVYNYANSTAWNTTSDSRVKTNIREISSGLDKILRLHPVHFEYIHKPGKTKTSFIAQEFEQVLPGHIVESSCPNEIAEVLPELKGKLIKSLDCDLYPYLVKAIQELKELFERRIKH